MECLRESLQAVTRRASRTHHVRQSLAEVSQRVAVQQEVDCEIDDEHRVGDDDGQLEAIVGRVREMVHEVANELNDHGRTDEEEEETDDGDERYRRAVEEWVPSAIIARRVVRREARLAAPDDDEKADVAEGERHERDQNA